MPAHVLPSILQHVRRLAATASSDEQLLADFLDRRSDEAFAVLMGRHGPMVLNVCRRVLHDAHAAEDVFQDTFLVLADRAGGIRQRASLAGFLHRVAYRLAVRARRRSLQSLPADTCGKTVEPADELAWKEVLGILDHELSRLSDRLRAPLVVCFLQGRTQDEAARQLGWSLNTLRRRLTQGRRLLEARLRGRGVTLSAALAGLLAARTVSVPGPLRAATLAAACARAISGSSAGVSVLASVRSAITLFLSTTAKKIGALVVAAALASALCFACWVPHAKEGTRDEGRGAREREQTPPRAPSSDPLPVQGAVRLGTARYRHGSRIVSFTVSADGRRAAVASGWTSFAPAQVFDLTDGRCLHSLPFVLGANVEAVGLALDGKLLAVKDWQFLTFRDAETGKEIRKIKYLSEGGGRAVTDWITFTPDGKQVAVTLMGDAIRLIDVSTGAVKRTFDEGAAARVCAFSADGKWMATGGYRQENGIYSARLWEVATGKELRRFAVGHELNRPIGALALSRDGAKLAAAAWGDGRLRLFEAATGKELKVFPKIGNDVQGVAFAPNGKSVAAAGDSIHFYDLASGKERLRIERRARGLAFSRDGTVLIGAVSGAIYRWDAASGRQLTPASAQDSIVEQILVSADGRRVLTLNQDGDLHVWDAAGGQPPRRIADGIERGVVASADGRFLAWTDHGVHGGSRIRLYDVAAQRALDRFPTFAEEASVAAFLPDSKTLLTLGQGNGSVVRRWDVASGKERRSFPISPVPGAVYRRYDDADSGIADPGLPFYTTRRAALSPDGKTLAVGLDWEGGLGIQKCDVHVRLWDVATGKLRHEFKEPRREANIPDEAGLGGQPESTALVRVNRKMKSADGRAFSPDGRFLADWAENPFGRSRMDHVYIRDTTTGRLVASLAAGPRPGAANAAFAPDGRTFATASADGTIRLWETASWKVRAEFRGHRDKVTALAFGPDGRLFTGGTDTVVLGWDVRPPRDPARGTLADAWEALASADAKVGFQAQGRFLAESDRAVAFFAARLTPAVRPDPARVQALIADLDSDTFATRERAKAHLKELWPDTAAVIRAVVAKSPSLEARHRAESILRAMTRAVTPPDKLRALRAAEILEWIATKQARTLLQKLAKGAPGARLTIEATAARQRLEGRKY